MVSPVRRIHGYLDVHGRSKLRSPRHVERWWDTSIGTDWPGETWQSCRAAAGHGQEPPSLSARPAPALSDAGWWLVTVDTTVERAPANRSAVDIDRPSSTPSRTSDVADLKWFERVGLWAPSTLIALASLVMVYAYLGTPVQDGSRGLTNLTESFGALERVALWQRALWWLPGSQDDGRFFELAPGAIAWSVRLSFVTMFVAQAWAFWLSRRGPSHPLWKWMIGPAAAHVVMLLLVPTNADVFFYEMSGDLAANGVNPYVSPLMEFPGNPLLPYNHWIEMTAVYGPVWTITNSAIMGLVGPDPVAATVAYKVILGAAALALAGLVYWFTRSLTRSQPLAAGAAVLVAWQPNMIVESTGQAHNDPVMLLLSTAGVFLAVAGGTRAVRGGFVLITLSALVKYVTLPLLGLLGLLRLLDRRKPSGLAGVAGSWVVDGLAIGAVLFAAFAPFWDGFGTLTEMFLEPGRLFTNPIWFDPYLVLEWLFPKRVSRTYADVTRTGLQLITIGIIVWVVIRFAKRMWEIGDRPTGDIDHGASVRPLLVGWTVILTTLALLPVNSHPWYWTWPIVPISVLIAYDARSAGVGTGPVPRWFWGYLVLTALMTLAYHTRIVHL